LKLSSIRGWLPLSYGAIAFFTAVALGGILLFALSSYYTYLERRYLQQNAVTVSSVLGQVLEIPGTEPLLQSQIDTLAYLTQTQLQVVDDDGNLIVRSGAPQSLQAVTTLSLALEGDGTRQEFSQTVASDNGRPVYTSLAVIEGEQGRITSESTLTGPEVNPNSIEGFATPLLNLETPGSYGLGGAGLGRSNQVHRLEIPGIFEDSPAMYLEMSQGPAFGKAVLNSVLVGIIAAGGIAVALATAVGWRMSRRLNRPITELVQATEKMAAGDLTVRTAVKQPDELGQLAQSFNTMAARTEETIQTLRNFLSDASHELRTPITSIRAFLELAEKTNPDNQDLKTAQRQTVRLQHVVDNLLDLSRLEGNPDAQQKVPVDLSQLIRERSEIYAAQAEQADIDFSAALYDEPVTVLGVPEQLYQVVDYLLDNALKFTPAGEQIMISLAQDAIWAVLRVCDTGIGLDPNEQEQIFNRFYRGRGVSDYPGSGLGLAITKQIVERHGGQITAVPQEKGACFVVHLPLA